ncbi:DUF3857 domain-containing protein [Mesoterricola silvestris]|uniref:DUF3857 domain-containing protein n=1 Tax=Mesoterricola silvestris TaxID=2927979 RepID=A0AA48GL49_9BACT|nr:DUF3857 domain-containing protein [Mesoterricola silvestris]BDU71789.1 hypothetical protein METEAL_09630 [Mesoterricola silvestris]
MRIGPFLAASLPCAMVLAAPAETDWHLLPALSADPALLLKAASAHKVREGQGILELLEDTRVAFDAQGRRTTHYRYVFRVDHESAIRSWRNVGTVWVPWHQERPRIRARVITPDGRAHELDGATLGEFPVNEDDTTLYDDRKRLAAPLPQLSVGSVAEVEIVTRETAPVHASGTLLNLSLHQPVQVLRTRVQVEVPEALPFRWKIDGLGPIQPQLAREGGMVRLALDLGPMEPPEEREPAMDPEASPRPELRLSTVTSWAAAASAYSAIANRQLEGADVGAWAREAAGDATEPRARINRILGRLHRSIRYTGVEFAEAGIVPRTPAETLKRGFGDCKDQATLLVALLREVGIPARLALLGTGPGRDIDPELPGLNHFDHAIVVVPGPQPLWIDPTAAYARAGELPFPDQGRWALVVDGATTALVRTPAAASGDNLTLETREVFLPEPGKARIVETSHPSGLAEMILRHDFRPSDPKQLRENLKRYVQGIYNAGDLGDIDTGDPSDLERPYTLRLEAKDCAMAVTSDVDAVVTLNAWAMTSRIRKFVPTSYDLKEKEAPTTRKQALLLPEPHAIEWRYRIVAPAGFEARPLPESGRLDFGPASLTRTYARSPEGQILATFRFDSGKALWTAAEVEKARAGLEAFGQAPPPRIIFDQVGEGHLAAGRIREAIQAFRSQTTAQPGKAVPLSRLAIALLRGGMGEAARDAARRACALDPTSMYAQRALGWVLQHDLVNRAYHTGWDFAGAVAAFRKAKELDPKDALSRRNLAILLEYNPAGLRYGPGADLEAAAREYRQLRADLKVEDSNTNLLIVLWRAGRHKEVMDLATSLPRPQDGYSWLLAGTALTQGTATALKQAATTIADVGQRRTALLDAGNLLVNARRYVDAATLLSAGADGAPNAPAIRSRIAVLARMRRSEDLAKEPETPASVVWRFLALLQDPAGSGEDPARFCAPALREILAKDGYLAALREAMGFEDLPLDGTGVPYAVALDNLRALTQVVVNRGGDSGFRVAMKMANSGNGASLSFHVIQHQGRFLLAATDLSYGTFGAEALRRLEAGDAAGAGALLDEASEGVLKGKQDDPLSGHPFNRFWKKGQGGTPAEIRLAATTLLVPEKGYEKAVPGLLAAGETSERIDLALLWAHRARNEFQPLLAVAERLVKAHPASRLATTTQAYALAKCRKWPQLLAACERALEKEPDDEIFVESRSQALGMVGRFQERSEALKAYIATGKASAGFFNNLAWYELTQGRTNEQTVDLARRALLLQAQKNGAAQHTLASILAERGEVEEALDIFLKETGALGKEEPRSQDWYLAGRIAEQFGEPAAAAACYKRVTPDPDREEAEGDSCFALAARRMKAMGV